MPRQPTCQCEACPKCRKRARARQAYQAMSVEERREWVGRRDPAAVKAADRARYRRDHSKRRAAADSYKRSNPEKDREAHIRWRGANPEKYKAHNAVSNAIRDGDLERGPCEVCGAEPAQAHHDDYDKPLEVRWLCRAHHDAFHALHRERVASETPGELVKPAWHMVAMRLRWEGLSNRQISERLGKPLATVSSALADPAASRARKRAFDRDLSKRVPCPQCSGPTGHTPRAGHGVTRCQSCRDAEAEAFRAAVAAGYRAGLTARVIGEQIGRTADAVKTEACRQRGQGVDLPRAPTGGHAHRQSQTGGSTNA